MSFDKDKFHLQNFLIEKELLTKVEEYRFANKCKSRTDAFKELIRYALSHKEQPRK